MSMTDEQTINVINQSIRMSMELGRGVFVGRQVMVDLPAYNNFLATIEDVGVNKDHGLIFKLSDLDKWFTHDTVKFVQDATPRTA